MDEGNTQVAGQEKSLVVGAPSPVEVHFFTRDDPRSWALMPQLLYRVYEFCRKTDGETEPSECVDLIRAWFMVGSPNRLALWGIVIDNRVVAHLFATTEPFGMDVLRYVLVRQAEVDAGVDAREASKEILEQAKAWTKSLGLSKVLALTHRNTAAMFRAYGFSEYKRLVRMDLDGPKPRLKNTGS